MVPKDTIHHGGDYETGGAGGGWSHSHTASTSRKQSQQEVELTFAISRPLPATHFLPVRLGVLKGSQPSLTVPPAGGPSVSRSNHNSRQSKQRRQGVAWEDLRELAHHTFTSTRLGMSVGEPGRKPKDMWANKDSQVLVLPSSGEGPRLDALWE